jgi:hypothetical protein
MSTPEIDFEAMLTSPTIRKSLSEFCGVDLTAKHITPLQAFYIVREAISDKKEFIDNIMRKSL